MRLRANSASRIRAMERTIDPTTAAEREAEFVRQVERDAAEIDLIYNGGTGGIVRMTLTEARAERAAEEADIARIYRGVAS